MDYELGLSEMRMVSVQNADPGAFSRAVPVEDAAQDHVGGGTGGDGKREEPLQSPGRVRG